MIMRIAADFAVLVHLGFIVFVVLGGLLAIRWPRIAWIHLPAAVWGALVEFGGWFCPLTPLETWLRGAAGSAGYSSGFIEHYLVPIVYPEELSRTIQLVMGTAVVLVNCIIYALVWSRWRKGETPCS